MTPESAKRNHGTRNTARLLFYLLSSILYLLSFPARAQVQQCVFTNFTMTGSTNDTYANFLPDNNPIIVNNDWYWFPPGGTNISSTNGVAQFNLVLGCYTLTFAGLPQSWHICVTNSGQPLNIAALVPPTPNGVIYSGIGQIVGAGGIVVYSQTGPTVVVSNSATGGGGGGGGFNNIILTNPPNSLPSFAVSTIFWPTNLDTNGASIYWANFSSNLLYGLSTNAVSPIAQFLINISSNLVYGNATNASETAAQTIANTSSNQVYLNSTNAAETAAQVIANTASNLVYINGTNAIPPIAQYLINLSSNLVYLSSQTGAQTIANTSSNLVYDNGTNAVTPIAQFLINLSSNLVYLNSTNASEAAAQTIANTSSNLVYVNGTNAIAPIAQYLVNLSSNLVYINATNAAETAAQVIANTTSNLLSSNPQNIANTTSNLVYINSTNAAETAAQIIANTTSNLVYDNGTNAIPPIAQYLINLSSNLVYANSQIGIQGIANTSSNLVYENATNPPSFWTSNFNSGQAIVMVNGGTNFITFTNFIGPAGAGVTNGGFAWNGSSYTNTTTFDFILNTGSGSAPTWAIETNGVLVASLTAVSPIGGYSGLGNATNISGTIWDGNKMFISGWPTFVNVPALFQSFVLGEGAATLSSAQAQINSSSNSVYFNATNATELAAQIIANTTSNLVYFNGTNSAELAAQVIANTTSNLVYNNATNGSAPIATQLAQSIANTTSNLVYDNGTNAIPAIAQYLINLSSNLVYINATNSAETAAQIIANTSSNLVYVNGTNAIAPIAQSLINISSNLVYLNATNAAETAAQVIANTTSNLVYINSTNSSAPIAQAAATNAYAAATNPPLEAVGSLTVAGGLSVSNAPNVIASDATNSFYFTNSSGNANLTNVGNLAWSFTLQEYTNFNGYTAANINTAISPVWEIVSNGVAICSTTNLFIGGSHFSTLDGSDSGNAIWGVKLAGPAFDIQGPINANGNFNGQISGNGAGLTNLGSLSGQFWSFNASSGNVQTYWSNDLFRLGWQASQNRNIAKLPIMGFASWYGAYSLTPSGLASILNIISTNGFYQCGYKWLEMDDGWGSTTLDSVNNLYMQPNSNLQGTFGSGTNGTYQLFHYLITNGINPLAYIDGGTNLSAGGFQHGLGAQYLGPNVNLFGSYGVAGIKADMNEWEDEEMAACVATNGWPIYLNGAVDPLFDNNGGSPMPTVYPAMFNGFRVVTGGDITSYPQLIAWMDSTQTNGWWKGVEPGRYIDMDFIGGEYNSGYGQQSMKSHLIACSLYSSPILIGSGPFVIQQWTNRDLLAIDQDSAVICARRWLQMSNCDVYVKPLGAPGGPQFAVGVFNRSSVNPTNITFALTNLWPLFTSGAQSFSVFDCASNGIDGSSGHWLSQNTNLISVTLNTNDSVLYRVTPANTVLTNVVTVNWPYSMTLTILSNGVTTTAYSLIDSMTSNYLFRTQITNNSSQETEEIAAAETVALGQQHGWLNKLDAFYPFMGASSNSTAANLISSSYRINWNATGLTYAWNGVTGDGSAGYGDTQFLPSGSSFNFQTNSACMFALNLTTAPTGSGFESMMSDAASIRDGILLAPASSLFDIDGLNNSQLNVVGVNYTVDGVTGNASGYWMLSRTASNLQIAYHDSTAVYNDSSAATAFPSGGSFLLFARNDDPGQDQFYPGTLGCAGFGSGFTQQQWVQMHSDLVAIHQLLGLQDP